jgi:hypothetical protein
MPLSLERLTYQSTATGSTASLLNLAAILAESHRNNLQAGLTGVLAAHRDRYIQVIEGPRPALDALLRRLEGDVRHKEIRILDRRPVATRRFADWTMASPRITPGLSDALDRLMDETPGADRIVDLLDAALAAEAGQAKGSV